MSNDNIKKEDLFNVIKYGHAWHLEKIKEEEPYLTDLILRNLEFESYSYNNILNDNYVYRPQKKII